MSQLFLYLVTNFQHLVGNGGNIDFIGEWHKTKLSIIIYNLEIQMYHIPVGRVIYVLRM